MKKQIYKFIVLILISIFANNTNAQMFWNQAVSFSGSSTSYLTTPNSALLNITGSFTIEAWVNPVNAIVPANQIILQKREGGNVVGYTLYLNSGRVAIRTNATTRLIGQEVLKSNAWSHITGTYNSASGLFSIYIDGALDTSVTLAGAAPVASTDSLFIGKGFNSPFNGQMDEVRIWNEYSTLANSNQRRHTTLATSSGIYDNLIMSLTFQDNESSGLDFSLLDWSGNGHLVTLHSASIVDLSDRPLQTIAINQSIELNGVNEYLAAASSAQLSPADVLTLEAWIYPESYDKSNLIIHKGSSDGTSTDYSFYLYEGRPTVTINNSIVFNSDDDIPLNKWTHVAFSFDGPNGVYNFYVNGELAESGVNFKGFITSGTDSLYLGGTPDLNDFDGYIDEVRITLGAKTESEIKKFLFSSIDDANDGPFTEVVYNLDGYALSNVGPTNQLYFRNGAKFSYAGAVNNKPLSPLNRSDANNFQEGYYLKTSAQRIPATGTSGLMVDDTLNVFLNETITDLNVFVALNHTQEQNLIISLVAPNGETVTMHNSNSLFSNSDNLVTIFNDQADSSIVNGRYLSFAPDIKPINNLNAVFGGDNSVGKWRLVINDNVVNDTGLLYGWGIQFNNRASKPTLLHSRSLIQGFYNSSTNTMIKDTMRFYMRYAFAPFTIVDSGKSYLGADGIATTTFGNLVNETSYYIHLKHRNSIQTWSSESINFDALTSQADYDFAFAKTQAYGDNMVQVDNSPIRFAIFGGDVDQNGIVDGSDQAVIDNDALNFASGYISTDITGDNIVDASDAAIADNNAANFVSAVIPVVLSSSSNKAAEKIDTKKKVLLK